MLFFLKVTITSAVKLLLMPKEMRQIYKILKAPSKMCHAVTFDFKLRVIYEISNAFSGAIRTHTCTEPQIFSDGILSSADHPQYLL